MIIPPIDNMVSLSGKTPYFLVKTHGLRFKKYLESRQQLAEKDKLLQKASTAHLPGREQSGELGKPLLVKDSGKLSDSIWGWLEVESQEGKKLMICWRCNFILMRPCSSQQDTWRWFCARCCNEVKQKGSFCPNHWNICIYIYVLYYIILVSVCRGTFPWNKGSF